MSLTPSGTVKVLTTKPVAGSSSSIKREVILSVGRVGAPAASVPVRSSKMDCGCTAAARSAAERLLVAVALDVAVTLRDGVAAGDIVRDSEAEGVSVDDSEGDAPVEAELEGDGVMAGDPDGEVLALELPLIDAEGVPELLLLVLGVREGVRVAVGLTLATGDGVMEGVGCTTVAS